MLPLGLELPGEPSVPEMIDTASLAEQLGYESIWLTETRFTRDAITTTSALATATRSARIATAVINPFTRGAVLTAVTAATLDEVCAGRFVLGIGPGSPTVLERQGIGFNQPLVRLRETVHVVRRLLRGEEVFFAGETISVAGARLDFTPVRTVIPIYFGVTGPRALALAGEAADGVILNGFVSLEYTKRAIEIVRSSAQANGRDPDEIEITGSIVVSVDANTAGAHSMPFALSSRFTSTSSRMSPENRGFLRMWSITSLRFVAARGPRRLPHLSPTQPLQTLHAQEPSPRCKKASRAVERQAWSCRLPASHTAACCPG